WLDALMVVFPFVRVLRVFAELLALWRVITVGPWRLQPYLVVLRRRGLLKLLMVSIAIVLITAVLEYLFEAGTRGATITSVSAALWWAAAMVTTIGSQY